MSKKSSTADAGSDAKKKGDDARNDDEPATIACSCGNMVAIGEPFCNICGAILEPPKDGEEAPPATPPGASMETHHNRDGDLSHDPMAMGIDPHGSAMYPPAPTSPMMQSMYPAQGAGAYTAPMQGAYPQTGYPQTGPGGYAGQASPASLYPGGACTCGATLTPGQAFCASCGQTVPAGGFRHAYAAPYGQGDASGRMGTRRERVLIVDGDADSTAYLQRVLSLELYEALVATDGHDGLILAITAQPDIIILDLSLPGLDGLSLCRVLRANPSTRHTPIVVVTARSSVEDETTALKTGADDYLIKPLDSTRLLARLEAQLRRLRTRR